MKDHKRPTQRKFITMERNPTRTARFGSPRQFLIYHEFSALEMLEEADNLDWFLFSLASWGSLLQFHGSVTTVKG